MSEVVEKTETKQPQPSGVARPSDKRPALAKSKRQQITGLRVNGQDAHGISGKPNASAISSQGNRIALDLGAFCQVVELPAEMANKGEVEISFIVKPLPGPQ